MILSLEELMNIHCIWGITRVRLAKSSFVK